MRTYPEVTLLSHKFIFSSFFSHLEQRISKMHSTKHRISACTVLMCILSGVDFFTPHCLCVNVKIQLAFSWQALDTVMCIHAHQLLH